MTCHDPDWIVGDYRPLDPSALLFDFTLYPNRIPQQEDASGELADLVLQLVCPGEEHSDRALTLSYVVNELLENTLRHGDGQRVGLRLGVEGGQLLIATSNHLRPEAGQGLRARLLTLLEGDPEAQVVAHVEAHVPEAGEGAGLGFLTMLGQFDVRLAWRLCEEELVTVARLEGWQWAGQEALAAAGA